MEESTKSILLNTGLIVGIITIVSPIIYGLLYLIWKNKIEKLNEQIANLNSEKKITKDLNTDLQKQSQILNESIQFLTKKIDSLEKKDVKNEKNYTRNDCVNFYDNIADHYDIDNSKEIWVTHRAIAKELNILARTKKDLSVLDVGGGTGTLLFDLLSFNESIAWTYVDASQKMFEKFKEKCSSLDQKIEIYNENFDTILGWQNKKYDVIVISFLFSSLSRIPNLHRIKDLLNKNGKIIFADADREYSKRLPYRVVINDTAHILDTKPLKLADILAEFSSIGFMNNVLPTIKKNEVTYSHVVVFEEK
jgi:ubiquinone/menaquinone biosynthesis C-methylase UbiE